MSSMVLQVNGEPMTVGEPLNICELIEQLGLGGGPVAVERNGEVVTRARHAETVLDDGDVVEIVHFVGGG